MTEKNAVDLFLDDVSNYLEKSKPNREGSSFDCFTSIWHAVLYLQRAVKAMREEKRDESATPYSMMCKRVDKAIELLSPYEVENQDHPHPILKAIKKAVSVLKGGVDV